MGNTAEMAYLNTAKDRKGLFIATQSNQEIMVGERQWLEYEVSSFLEDAGNLAAFENMGDTTLTKKVLAMAFDDYWGHSAANTTGSSLKHVNGLYIFEYKGSKMSIDDQTGAVVRSK